MVDLLRACAGRQQRCVRCQGSSKGQMTMAWRKGGRTGRQDHNVDLILKQRLSDRAVVRLFPDRVRPEASYGLKKTEAEPRLACVRPERRILADQYLVSEGRPEKGLTEDPRLDTALVERIHQRSSDLVVVLLIFVHADPLVLPDVPRRHVHQLRGLLPPMKREGVCWKGG